MGRPRKIKPQDVKGAVDALVREYEQEGILPTDFRAAQNSLKRVLFNTGEFDFDPVEVNGIFYGVLHAEVDVAGYVLRNAQPGVTELVELSDLFGVEVDFSLLFDHTLFVSFDSEVFQNVTAFDVDDGSHLFCRKADRCKQNCDYCEKLFHFIIFSNYQLMCDSPEFRLVPAPFTFQARLWAT